MIKKFLISILIFTIFTCSARAQQETYSVTRAPFCSDKYDEYSPVYYIGGIVFTSNRGSGSLVDYSSSGGKSTFDIKYIDTTGSVTWKKTTMFSKNLLTPLNEGPVTFTSSRDTIYFTRNLKINGSFAELSNARNKLGIFTAVKEGDDWVRIRELRFNNEWYNISTPWLSPDGKKLYFASDKPDGYGGSDIYYCTWKGDYWGDPVNIGPSINTKGNEAYPFLKSSDDLFFASDGHPGMGGKDIFFSHKIDSVWQAPVHLDPPVNSEFDDFGIITDLQMNSGYFSSSREKTLDIFFFRTIIPQIFYSELQHESQFCFIFSDESNIRIDNTNLMHEWDFGDGSKAGGQKAEHCYAGPGNYPVKLNITDRRTGKVVFNKLSWGVDLKNVEQPYINCPDVVVTGEEVSFDSRKSNLPGYQILSSTWQFGNSERVTGEEIKYTFRESGAQLVKLGLKIRQENTGTISQRSVSKEIRVLSTKQEALAYQAKNKNSSPKINITDYDHAAIKVLYSAENEVSRETEFIVELVNSQTRLGINNPLFTKVPSRYSVSEIFLPGENIFSYVVDRELDLMSAIPAYNEMVTLGYRNTIIKTLPLKRPAEKELYNLKKIFGLSSDIYFDNLNRLTSNAYLFLDQIVKIMNKYPETRMEIAVYTDNTGTPQNSLQISESRAKTLVDYLQNKGISTKRLIAKPRGGDRPVASNSNEAGKKLNRRIDFLFLEE